MWVKSVMLVGLVGLAVGPSTAFKFPRPKGSARQKMASETEPPKNHSGQWHGGGLDLGLDCNRWWMGGGWAEDGLTEDG